jgi:hypothetical protein
MPDLVTLLAKGYFPEELPPPFITDNYSQAILNNIHSIPSSFTQGNLKAKIGAHSIARVDILRRPIGIPNPVLFFNLCKDIILNWPALASHFAHSAISASSPVDDPKSERAIWWSKDFKHHIPLRARVRSTNKWILKTDIAKFYPSIYTYSIPWALHGKLFSKTNQGLGILGNSLDRWIRNGQDRQTVGIPIGPDTSLVIAEIILSSVDLELQRRIPRISCLRIVDDYEFGCKSYSQAEETLAILQENLKEYELDINFEKTKIIKLPISFEPTWISELRHYEIRDTTFTQRNDLVQFFSRVFDLSNQNLRDSILKYAIRRLRNLNVLDVDNWNLLESFLLQCAMVEAGVVQAVLELLVDHNKHNYPLSLSLINEVLNHIVINACPLGYTNETAWSLWGLIHWNLKIDLEAATVISKTSDTVIALLALDAQRRGLIPNGLDLTLWESFMTTDDLYGKQWLLSYEANKKGWLPSYGTSADHVMAESNFNFLKSNDVSFYNEKKFTSAKTLRAFPSALLRMINVSP